MQFSTILFTIFATLATAAPSPLEARNSDLCSSALDSAQCCDVSVDGIVNLNCAAPSSTPSSLSDFKSICAAGGQSAHCCKLPMAGHALLCTAQ